MARKWGATRKRHEAKRFRRKKWARAEHMAKVRKMSHRRQLWPVDRTPPNDARSPLTIASTQLAPDSEPASCPGQSVAPDSEPAKST